MSFAHLAAGGWTQALIVQIMGFLLLLAILAKFVVPALRGILGGRTKGIEETFSKLEKETAEASRELAEIRAKLAAIEEESKRRHAEAMADAEKVRSQTLADAEASVRAAVAKGRQEIETARNKAALELRQEAERLTMEAADHLVRSAMNEAIDQKLVDGYLSRIEGAARS